MEYPSEGTFDITEKTKLPIRKSEQVGREHLFFFQRYCFPRELSEIT